MILTLGIGYARHNTQPPPYRSDHRAALIPSKNSVDVSLREKVRCRNCLMHS